MILLFVLFNSILISQNSQGGWKLLLNGKDLSNWDTYIGAKYTKGEWSEWTSGTRLGLNNDPNGLFKIILLEGKPTLHISGERFGGISTHEEFENYHLHLKFKWGKNKYPPKENSPRDSGILYHAVGEHGADSGFWMRSQEFQIQEGDTGDYWGCAGATFDIPVSNKGGDYMYDPTGNLIHFSHKLPQGRHASKSVNAEKRSGEWNTIDLYCFGSTAIHVVNGKKVMVLYNSSQYGEGNQEIPLTKGKIQLQAEGAEIFYQDIRIKPLKELPMQYLD